MLLSGGAANVDASQRTAVWFYFRDTHHSSSMPIFKLLNGIFPKRFIHLFWHKFCQWTTCCSFSFQYCHKTRTQHFSCKNHWLKFWNIFQTFSWCFSASGILCFIMEPHVRPYGFQLLRNRSLVVNVQRPTVKPSISYASRLAVY